MYVEKMDIMINFCFSGPAAATPPVRNDSYGIQAKVDPPVVKDEPEEMEEEEEEEYDDDDDEDEDDDEDDDEEPSE